ncbi:Slp family lipoprotein [Aquimonas voraii]|uniref:Outer membrane lipoprotein n=1 Tax=Aquimonas voraii TaxID=265719 RepID=A0A1G6SAK5_9GAMM|nr:Slp family lipoprotein [Aquimonas voraii]SDD13147.1 outer membrane lipoprotein [Aquimonas voraii]
MKLRGILSMLAVLLLAGCVPTPVFRDAPSVPSPSPRAVAAQIDTQMDRNVLWGGMVIALNEYEGYVEIELLGFPTDSQARPIPQARDGGRFIAIRAGRLDPNEVVPGRFLTLTGRITGEREVQLGEQRLILPEVDAREIHLWPRDWNTRERPRISVGIGVRGGF